MKRIKSPFILFVVFTLIFSSFSGIEKAKASNIDDSKSNFIEINYTNDNSMEQILESTKDFIDSLIKEKPLNPNISSENLKLYNSYGLSSDEAFSLESIGNDSDLETEQIIKLYQFKQDILETRKTLVEFESFIKKKSILPDRSEFLLSQLISGKSIKQINGLHDISYILNIPIEDTILILENGTENTSENFTFKEKEIIEEIGKKYEIEVEFFYKVLALKLLSPLALYNQLINYELSIATANPFNKIGESNPDDYSKYFTAPYNLKEETKENINSVTGALTYEVPLTLPGRNGLDLDLGIKYDSSISNLYNEDYTVYEDPSYSYTVHYYVDAYHVSGGSSLRIKSSYEGNRTFSNLNAALNSANSWDKTVEVPINNKEYIVYYYSSSIEEKLDYIREREYNIITPITYYERKYDLGSGWTFNFSSVETSGSQRYLHLADGATYLIEFTPDTADSNLKGYTSKDLIFENDGATYSNGSVSSAYVLTYKNGKKEYFSNDGSLLGIKDRFNNTINFEYKTLNSYPVISKITDSIGRIVSFNYQQTSNGKTITVTLPSKKTIQYEMNFSYQPDYVLTAIKDEANRTTRFTYSYDKSEFSVISRDLKDASTNVFANLKSITFPTGATSQYTYEKVRGNIGKIGVRNYYRVTKRQDLLSINSADKYNVEEYSYVGSYTGDEANFGTTELPSAYSYQTLKKSADNTVIKYIFNNKHLLIKEETIDKDGNILTQVEYQYDANKLPIAQKKTFKAPQTGRSTIKETFTTYDSWKNITQSIDELGYKSFYQYHDSFKDRLIKEEIQSSTGEKILDTQYEINPGTGTVKSKKEWYKDGNLDKYKTINYTYDAYGNLIQESINDNLVAQTTLYAYDAAYNYSFLTGKSINTKDIDGNSQLIKEHYTYDLNTGDLLSYTNPNGKVITYSYDKLGRLLQQKNPDSSTVTLSYNDTENTVEKTNEIGIKVKNIYNSLGFLLKEQIFNNGKWTTLKEYGYTSDGLVAWTKDALGKQTKYNYDTFGRLTKTTYPDGTLTTTIYEDGYSNDNTMSSLIIKTDEVGNVSKSYYDKKGQLTSQTIGDVTTRKEYDFFGNVTKEVDGKGFSTIYQSNALQQLSAVTEANGNQTSYSYDILGNLVKVLYPDGSFVTKKYDENNRLIEELDGNGDKLRYYYDQNSNLIKKIDKAGNIFTYEYNTRNLLTKMYSGNNVISYTYDTAGNRTKMVDSTGTTSYTYTPTGQLKSVTYPDNKIISYTYDAADRRTQLVDPFGKSIFYQYDEVNRLKSVHVGKENATAEASYQFDNRGSVTKKTLKNGTISAYTYDVHQQVNSLTTQGKITTSNSQFTYQYDKNGNLIKQNSQTYTYDNVDRITREDQLNKEYVYDKKNNRSILSVDSLESILGADSSYTYDIWGRLASVTLENGQVITYRYNGDGFLYEREFNGERTRYYYDGSQLIAEATVTNNVAQLKARYTRGKDFTELLSVELANGTKGYYVQERHGDIIRIEGETGNVLNEYTYDIWGNPIVQNETIANPFRYSGEWVEEKTNLQYLRARWYDAKLGRFISEDPVEGIFTAPLSLNRYTYAENNPLKYVDPSGNIVGTLIDVGFLIYDTAKFIKEPSKANAGNVGLSFASALIPGVTGGSAAAKAVAKGNSKPLQNHHYATNKSKKYTPQIESITKKYNLDLDDTWNKEYLPHQGRHPNAYHDYVLDNLRTFDNLAKGDRNKFLKLFEGLKSEIRNNPDMLYKDYWRVK